jgi:hypothetical protein
MAIALRRRSIARSTARTIALCVLVAGTLDIADALVFYGLRGVPAIRLLQNIANGLIGPRAFRGGLPDALLGLGIHYAITLFWATLFVVAARRFAVLRRRAIASGVLHGLLIYAVMNFLVLPHTHAASRHHQTGIVLVNAVAALIFFMGLPIALINRRSA